MMRGTGVVVAVLGGVLALGGCTGDSYQPPVGLTEDQLRDQARVWANDELGAGRPGGGLAGASVEWSQNDEGVAPSFAWVLRFRPGRATVSGELVKVVERACAFPLAQDQFDTRVTVELVLRSVVGALVPTGLEVWCADDLDRVATRFGHLDGHPYPRGVVGSGVWVWPDEFSVFAELSGPPSLDATWRVEGRAADYFCDLPDAGDDIVRLRWEDGRPGEAGTVYCRNLD